MGGIDRALPLLLCVALAACAGTPSRAPVAERSPADASAATYRVRQGDTLYSIAWRHGLDYKALARLNGIRAPYVIRPGQTLALRSAPSSALAPSGGSSRATGRAPTFRWPGVGRVLGSFGHGNKGVDMAIRAGTSIGSVAAGEVVYAGGGLRGYRALVIVKHDSRWLSAYSFNSQCRVKEGDLIVAGAPLADVRGQGSAAALHFEIRKDGTPVDPRDLMESR